MTGRPAERFTVVIPTNRTDTIADSVGSAIGQTYPPAEVIVVDDGCEGDVAAALGELVDRVDLVRIAPSGPSAARNVAIERATGDFVAFLDADDRYEPEFLASLRALSHEQPELDILTADVVFDGGPHSGERFYALNSFPTGDQRAEILRSCFLTIMAAVRTTALREAGGLDETLPHGGDWDLWVRLIRGGSRVGLVDRPLARYRIHPAQVSAQRARSLLARVRILEKVLAAEPDLSDGERATIAALVDEARRRGLRATARDASQPWRRRGAAAIGVALPFAAAKMAAMLQPKPGALRGR